MPESENLNEEVDVSLLDKVTKEEEPATMQDQEDQWKAEEFISFDDQDVCEIEW